MARVGYLTDCLINFEKSACRGLDLALNAAAQVNSSVDWSPIKLKNIVFYILTKNVLVYIKLSYLSENL